MRRIPSQCCLPPVPINNPSRDNFNEIPLRDRRELLRQVPRRDFLPSVEFESLLEALGCAVVVGSLEAAVVDAERGEGRGVGGCGADGGDEGFVRLRRELCVNLCRKKESA